MKHNHKLFDKNVRKIYVFIAICILAVPARTALAASWWESLFGLNNNNSTTSTTSTTATPATTAVQEPERITYDKQVLAQDQTAMQQAVQQFQNDRAAGLDTTADMKAIQTQRENIAAHLGNLRTDAVAAGLPANYGNPYAGGYGRRFREQGWNGNGAPYPRYNARYDNGTNPGYHPAFNDPALAQSRETLRNDYQKLWQDKQAGADLTADQQQLQKDREAFQTARQQARSNYQAHGGTPWNGQRFNDFDNDGGYRHHRGRYNR